MTRMATTDQFTSQLMLVAMNYKWYPNKAVELNAIASALAGDSLTRDLTLSDPGPSLRPGSVANTPFTNAALRFVNQGRGGNLTPTEMSDAITAGLSEFIPPVNTTPPAVTGTTTLSCTMGNWQYAPTGYLYQWLRGGTAIGGATANTYTVVGADSGTNVSCRVTASNAAGSTSATSNAIAVP